MEPVDRTILSLGREIEMFKPIIATAVRGADAVLIVEFADFRKVKRRFDPDNVLNPSIVDLPRMDDRAPFRYPPDYRVTELKTALDWSAYPGAGGGFQGAVEMCNNNGACRKLEADVICPSFRATRNEKDVARGRASTPRLSISGQLGPEALSSDEMMETLKLCVSCKACRHECPGWRRHDKNEDRGADRAGGKTRAVGAGPAGRLSAALCRAGRALAPLANARNHSSLLRTLLEKFADISAQRKLPEWRRDVFSSEAETVGPADGHEVILFADTFNRAYERENLDAALRVLVAGGYRVHIPKPADGGRPLCCGRTFLSTGLVDHARAELDRLVATYAPFAARGVPIIGLEPSCLLTLGDELLSLRSNNAVRSIRGANCRCSSATVCRAVRRPAIGEELTTVAKLSARKPSGGYWIGLRSWQKRT